MALIMDGYRELYTLLFNRITDAIERLDNGQPARARDILISAQREAEELFITGGGEG